MQTTKRAADGVDLTKDMRNQERTSRLQRRPFFRPCAGYVSRLLFTAMWLSGCSDDALPFAPGQCVQDSDCQRYQVCVVLPSPVDAGTLPEGGAHDGGGIADDASGDGDSAADGGLLEDAAPDDAAGIVEADASHEEMDASGRPSVEVEGGAEQDAAVPIGVCQCSSAKCGEFSFCDAEDEKGKCVEVECHSLSDCAAREVCHKGSCYDLSGKCTNVSACRVSERIRREFTMTCAGTCRIELPTSAEVFPTFYLANRTLKLVSPEPWDEFADPTSLAFEWESPPDDHWSMVVVVDRLVTEKIAAAVKWVAYIPNDRTGNLTSMATLADGQWVDNGKAVTESRALDANTMYYAYVLHVREGKVRAYSAEVPFRVGSAWPQIGQACERAADPLTACRHPLRPQACSASGCQVLCASDDDCAGYLGNSTSYCSAPDDNDLRFCMSRI